jgi:hypothetical protein
MIAAEAEFGGIQVATANSFVGGEKAPVFVDSTAAENLGGKVGFVADRHRIAIILTRQNQFLAIFGDTKCTAYKNANPEGTTAEEKQKQQLDNEKKYKLDCVRALWKYFEETKRIIYEDAHKITESIVVLQVTEQQVTSIETRIEADRNAMEQRRGGGQNWSNSAMISPQAQDGSFSVISSWDTSTNIGNKVDQRQYGGGNQSWDSAQASKQTQLPLRDIKPSLPSEVPSVLSQQNLKQRVAKVNEKFQAQGPFVDVH